MAEPPTPAAPGADASSVPAARFLDRAPAVRYVADAATRRILAISGDTLGLVGLSPADIVGLDASDDLIHPDDRGLMIDGIAAIGPGDPPQTARYRVLHADGSHHWVQERRRVIVGDGRPLVVGVVTDITAHRAADIAELAELERSAHSERAAALAHLAGGVAHQFNNILTAIHGYTALAQESLAADDPARELLDEALAAGARAREIAASLLAFAGGVVLRPTECDLNAVVSAAIARAWGPPARVGLIADLHPGPLAVIADPGRIEDAIAGLLLALRGLEPDAPLSIITAATDEAAYVEVVEPTGRLGDDPGALVLPFRRPPERVAVDDLAFAAADGIARGSGGRFEVEARAFGTVVRFSVPRAGGPALATGSRQAALAFVAGGGIIGPSIADGRLPAAEDERPHRRVILIVDDDEGVRTFMRALVARSGCEAITAASATEAIEILGGSSRIDALVADVVMPAIGGVALADIAADLRPGIAILYVSGDPGRNLPRDFGGRPFLPKPFGPAAFRDALRGLFERVPEA